MAAYLYADIEVSDAAVYENYRHAASSVVTAHGGRYLARGGAAELLEGDLHPHRVVLLEFPDMARLKAFYYSAEYQALITVRQAGARARFIAVDGVRATQPPENIDA